VKAKTNNRDSNDKLALTIEGKCIKDYCDLANVFNDYFINATNTHQANDMSKNLQALSNPVTYPQLNMAPVNAKEIKDIIRTLKWKTSYGYDEIPLKILGDKCALHYLSTNIFVQQISDQWNISYETKILTNSPSLPKG
jgi:hypothetical protein